MLNRELWVVEEIVVHHTFRMGSDLSNHKSGSRLVLVCYNQVTKELLHKYGPFTDAEELFQWAKEHGVKLGELPDCDHSMWSVNKKVDDIINYQCKKSLWSRIKEVFN